MTVSMARGLAATYDFVIGDAPAVLAEISHTLLIMADVALTYEVFRNHRDRLESSTSPIFDFQHHSARPC